MTLPLGTRGPERKRKRKRERERERERERIKSVSGSGLGQQLPRFDQEHGNSRARGLARRPPS